MVQKELAVLHQNSNDLIPSARQLREVVTMEMCGSILCRPVGKARSDFMKERILALKCSIARIRGVCETLHNRPYHSPGSPLDKFLIELDGIFSEVAWKNEVFNVIEQQVNRMKQWEAEGALQRLGSPQRPHGNTHATAVRHESVNSPAQEVWASCEVACLHRIHAGPPHGAHRVQAQIGMSLPLQEVVQRLTRFSAMLDSVSPGQRALVTFDDGFRDVLLLQDIFSQLSNLQPVLFIPSTILNGHPRQLPLSCLYAYCAENEFDPNSQKLGDIERSVLKSLPQGEQYERLQRAGVDTELPVEDLLSIEEPPIA